MITENDDVNNKNEEQEVNSEEKNEEANNSLTAEECEEPETSEEIEPEVIEDEEIELESEEELSSEEKIEFLTEEMETLKEERDKYYDQLTRLKADFANYRKRTKKEKKGLNLKAKIEVLEEILPIIDNFERALEATDKEDDFKQGIEKIYKHFVNTLNQQGLEAIEAEGKEFNPRYHEAIMQVNDTEEESEIIVEEFQKGYMFKGKVIRPAMVKVAE